MIRVTGDPRRIKEGFNFQHGFSIKFANGLEVSVMIDRGNYCSNRHANELEIDETGCVGCKDAEVYVTDSTGRGLPLTDDFTGDGIASYVSAEQIAKIFAIAANWVKPITGCPKCGDCSIHANGQCQKCWYEMLETTVSGS